MQFNQLNLKPFLTKGIEDLQFSELRAIQERVIPLALKHRDLIAISQTGTGKTHAFLIPIMEQIDLSRQSIQAVITAPTRELAMQIYLNAKALAKHQPDIDIMLITGGEDRERMISRLQKQPHIIIGTPGRIKDLFINDHVLKVTTANVLVVDEADMTFDMGFLEDVDMIAGKMNNQLQMMVFSATISQQIKPFLKKYLKQPQIIDLTSTKSNQPKIIQYLVPTKERPRLEILKQILKGFDPYVCLIFTNTRKEAQKVYQSLLEDGYDVIELHGDLEARERKKIMRRINAMAYKYIVATDIAARGIDVDGVSHVINYHLPLHDLSFYTHRVGRTGRNQYEGYAYTLYNEKDKEAIKQLMDEGVEFEHITYQNDEWTLLKPFDARQTRRIQPKEVPNEVVKILGKKKKVKPGYKKKRKEEIKSVMRKEKREFIKNEIKKQKKERAKQAQIRLRQEG